MTQHSEDLVLVAAGSLVEIQAWGDVLLAEGILYRLVGDNLVAGLGTALPNSVELWVHRADAEAAETAMADRFHNSLDDTLPL
jgi:putative signal transducing protein